MNHRVLCIWLPHWPIQRLLAERLERDGGRVVHGPLSVVGGEDAPLSGVTTEHDPRACRRALRRLARWCQRFSPYVGLEDADEPESLFLDITGCTHLFGGEPGLIEQVVRAFGRRRLAICAAVADTPGAAWAVAHSGECSGIEDRKSTIAPGVRGPWSVVRGEDSPLSVPTTDNGQQTTDHHSPLTTHPADALPVGSRLNALPVEALRLPVETIELLRDLDLRTVGQLEALPRGTLPSRFGPLLLERLDQLFGRVPETFAPERFTGPIEAGWTFDDAIADRRTLEIVLGRLIEQVIARLEPRGEGVVRLVCGFESLPRTMGHGPRTLTLGLARPTRSVRHLCELVRLRLERLELPAEVAAVFVRAAATAPLETRQLELFATDAGRDRRRRVAALIERLTSRLGERSVLQPRLVPDFQPEFAVRFEPLLGQQTFRFAWPERSSSLLHPPSSPADPRHSGRFRPLRLLSHANRVKATSIVPDGPPIRFPWRGREQRVLRWWGPERIETGWWRQPHVRRDYYRVETAAGERFWLFRERPGGEWFLHGLFE